MDVTKSRLKEGSKDEYEDYTETETLNSMVPIWRKNKNELKDEDYNNFYKEKFFDYTDPLTHIHTKAEGTATYNALLYLSLIHIFGVTLSDCILLRILSSSR